MLTLHMTQKRNETNRKVQLGHRLVNDNAHSPGMLVLLVNQPNAKQDQRVYVLERGSNVDDVGYKLTGQPD